MRKYIYSLITSLFYLVTFAQTDLNLPVYIADEDQGYRKATITRIDYDKTQGHFGYIIRGLEKDGAPFGLNCSKTTYQIRHINNNIEDFWASINIKSLKNLSGISDLYNLRVDAEEDALKYISNLKKCGLIFDDPYLESYIYSLISKITPKQRPDGFPYNINVVIVNDESLNACIYPNGSLLINTGLLANLHTEEELVAVLSHEIAHFVGNHSLINIQKSNKRAERAKLWASIATALAGAAEIYSASQGYYTGGSLTASTAILATSVANEILDSMGLKFNNDQEKEADFIASKALLILGYSQNGCASVFTRMKNVYNAEGNWLEYLISSDHPSLEERINNCGGTPNLTRNKLFEQKISFTITNTAIYKFNHGRFSQALNYVNQNIENGVGTDDDFLIKGRCLLCLYDNEESNKEALGLINKAKEINPKNINILRSEIIVNMRLDRQKAANLISEYMNKLTTDMSKIKMESTLYKLYEKEYDWARRMSFKIKGMI